MTYLFIERLTFFYGCAGIEGTDASHIEEHNKILHYFWSIIINCYEQVLKKMAMKVS